MVKDWMRHAKLLSQLAPEHIDRLRQIFKDELKRGERYYPDCSVQLACNVLDAEVQKLSGKTISYDEEVVCVYGDQPCLSVPSAVNAPRGNTTVQKSLLPP